MLLPIPPSLNHALGPWQHHTPLLLAASHTLLLLLATPDPHAQRCPDPPFTPTGGSTRRRFVNTYGAFGSVTKIRYEVVVEGTADESPTDEAAWREYEFLAKPGDLKRSPPVVSPYHLRLDWLMWFLPFSSWRANPWLLRLAAKLLQVRFGERSAPCSQDLFHMSQVIKRENGVKWRRKGGGDAASHRRPCQASSEQGVGVGKGRYSRIPHRRASESAQPLS